MRFALVPTRSQRTGAETELAMKAITEKCLSRISCKEFTSFPKV